MLRCLLLVLVLLVFAQLPGGQTYEVVFPRRLHTVYKRDTQSIYPDVLQYEILLGGKPTVIHIEKTEGLFAENYTESHYLQDGTLVTSHPEHKDHCNYQGHVKHENNSMVTLSTCNGLSGLIQTREQRFFIEPLKFTDSGEHAVYEQVEESKTGCGVSENATKQKQPSFISFRASADEKENLWNARKYIELFMVADLSMYKKYERNTEDVKQHLIKMVNFINTIYKKINIFVALIGIEVWDSKDQIEVVSDFNVLLQRFQNWRLQNLLPRKPHDNAQFLTNVDFDGSTVGLAALYAMCEANSAGINQDHSIFASSVGATVAHEMGHNLGMKHDADDCTCGGTNCVMSSGFSSSESYDFSSCSIADLRSFIYTYLPGCMSNMPQTSQLLTPPVCGNKFTESGEQCDCGDPKECTSDCCAAKTCTLKPGCQCDDVDLCCEHGAITGSDDCFSWNSAGSKMGFCSKEGEKYIACGKEDVMCGLLYCSGGMDTLNIQGLLVTFGQCKAFIFDRGMVAAGTKCSATNVCINTKCTNIEEAYKTGGCEAKCKGHAVCDHDLECHCEEGWAPPDCTSDGGTGNGFGFTDGPVPSFSVLYLCSWCWTSLLPIFSILVSNS
ncbi:disintegrin and metalloproteinase domain-containing protein 28-like isoform X2 [Ranitomeya variabilis]|uniref:disintegrin and metalloproteinase domain-containing protein 28-like isoform X2 n=1 Tax=Ranitomeya variabilis TaxID=490064 RepID=UPI004056A70C